MIATVLLLLLALFGVEPEKSGMPSEGAEEAAGTGFIMHHVQDRVMVHLPTVFGVDLSITKHVFMMMLSAALLAVLIPIAARRRQLVPRGITNAFEAIVVFLREDIIEPNLPEGGKRFTPYLLTAFFFILTMNLLGLTPAPLGATATSNISITAGMALLTFFIVNLAGIREHGLLGYVRTYVPSGVPALLAPLLFLIEVLGLFTKHLALAIRLFANMVAGHIVIFTLLYLVFAFKNWLIAPFPILFIVAVSLLEILIALIQAYIFTILSAVFIGMAVAHEH
jgi:F-type H+-transporting ATPase subunit a